MLEGQQSISPTELEVGSKHTTLPERGSGIFQRRRNEILVAENEPGNMYEPKRGIMDSLGSFLVDALGTLHDASRSFARTRQGRAIVLGLQLMSHSGISTEAPKQSEGKISEIVEWIEDTCIDPIIEEFDEIRVRTEALERTVETPRMRQERMNETFDDAADQLRDMDHLKEQWGEETIESMAQTIELFDVQTMWSYLSENSGIPIGQVADNSDIRGVFVYDDTTLERISQTYDVLVETGRITTRDPHAFEGLEHLQQATGLYDGGYIFLNMSDLLEDAQEHQYDPNIGLANTIKHESLHSFHATELSDWNNSLYEGMVEYMSEEMNKAVYLPIYGENYSGFVGYDTGDTATAAVLEASLGQNDKAFYATLITGDASLVVEAFDREFGDGSFSHIDEMPDESAPPRFIHFDRVDKILDLAGDNAQDIVRVANEHICDDQGIILHIDEQGIHGTVMASGNFISGYANGNLDLDIADGKQQRVYYSMPGYSNDMVDVEMNLIDHIFEERLSLGLSYESPADVRVGDVPYDDLVRLTLEGIKIK